MRVQGALLKAGKQEKLRFVDLCAGLGGFHQALKAVETDPRNRNAVHFECVLAAELDPELRRLYVANFPETRHSYAREFPRNMVKAYESTWSRLGPLSDALQIYDDRGRLSQIHGDLRALVDERSESLRKWPNGDAIVPSHDLLCAGFPCQPFSKSGAQRGFADADGTVFHLISIILKERRPGLVLLENVGNFERHDGGNTWKRVKEILGDLEYDFKATTHVGSPDGGHGLVSPHHIGLSHHRERFFIAARHKTEDRVPPFGSSSPFPVPPRRRSAHLTQLEASAAKALRQIITHSASVCSEEDFSRAKVAADRLRCAAHWQLLLDRIKEHDAAVGGDPERSIQPMPSFPIWGFELDPWNHYPISSNPKNHVSRPRLFNRWRRRFALAEIKRHRMASFGPTGARKYLAKRNLSRNEIERLAKSLPSYAISRDEWPRWKQRFIEQNREWGLRLWRFLDKRWLRGWLEQLYEMAPSHQKFEWNCQGEELDLWKTVLQFRPSGLRTKRFAHVPALVAMTTTQVPVVPRLVEEPGAGRGLSSRVRHILPIEALQLQGFPEDWKCPESRDMTFQALGNAVHVGLVAHIFGRWFYGDCESSSPTANVTAAAAVVSRSPRGRVSAAICEV